MDTANSPMTPETHDLYAGRPPVPLAQHASIVNSVYEDFRSMEQMHRVITGHQHSDGHRYSGERCVWCGVNYLDRLLYDDEDSRCPGPAEGEWSDDWWPLAKVDALLAEHRAEVRASRSADVSTPPGGSDAGQ